MQEAERLSRLGAAVVSIGKSVFGREIVRITVGGGRPKIIVTGGIHARENVTVRLAVEAAREAIKNGFPGTAHFVPMLNPDGAAIAARRGGELWKANGRGVDLNVNFDARWGTGKQNVFAPAPENYVGEYPFSEPETRAIRDFTLAERPDFTISYHAKGQVVYWYFHQRGAALCRDERIARELCEKLGYRQGEASTDSAGGYKDWCVEKLGIPAITVEVGADALDHPIEYGDIPPAERERNIALPAAAARIAAKILREKEERT